MEIYLFRSWKRLSSSTNPRHLRARLKKKIEVSMSTGVPALDSNIAYFTTVQNEDLNGQIDLKLEPEFGKLLCPNKYVIVQQRNPEKNEFEFSLTVTRKGEKIFEGTMVDKRFLGLSDKTINEILTEIEWENEGQPTVEQISNSAERLEFTIHKEAVEIKDSVGSAYFGYTCYERGIYYLSVEFNPLHYIFWSEQRKLVEGDFNLNASKVATSYFGDLCFGLIEAAKDRLAKFISRGLDISLIGNWIDMDYLLTYLDAIVTYREYLRWTPQPEQIGDADRQKKYMDAVRDVDQVLDKIAKSYDYLKLNNIPLFVKHFTDLSNSDVEIFNILGDDYEINIDNCYHLNTEKVSEMFKKSGIIEDLKESARQREIVEAAYKQSGAAFFWRRLHTYRLVPSISELAMKIILKTTPTKLEESSRVYPLNLKKKTRDLEEDRTTKDLIKDIKLEDGKYWDAKLENKLVWIRESATSTRKEGLWEMVASSAIGLTDDNCKLICIGSHIAIQKNDNQSLMCLHVLVANKQTSEKDLTSPKWIWYNLSTTHEISKPIGQLPDGTIVLLTNSHTDESFITFSRRDDDRKVMDTFQEISILNLFPNDRLQQVEGEDNNSLYTSIFLLNGDLLSAIKLRDKFKDRNITIWKVADVKSQTIVKGKADGMIEKLAEYHERVEDSIEDYYGYRYELQDCCTFFKFSSKLYFFVNYSYVFKNLFVYAFQQGTPSKITCLANLSKAISSKASIFTQPYSPVYPRYSRSSRRLVIIKPAEQMDQPLQLFYFRLS